MNLVLLPAARYTTSINYVDAVNSNIIDQLVKVFPEARNQVKEFAKKFRGSTLTDTAYNVWKFAKDHVDYKADGEVQKIKMPARLIADGTGDCKSYSLLCAAILSWYPFKNICFRFASYKTSTTPSHVYVVCKKHNGSEIIVDAVWNRFNSQKDFTYKKDVKLMTVQTLSGTEADPTLKDKAMVTLSHLRRRMKDFAPGTLTQIALQNRISEIKKAIRHNNFEVLNGIGKRVRSKTKSSRAKRILAAPLRKAYLTAVRLNYRGLAKRVLHAIKTNSAGTKQTWEKNLGGKFAKLQEAATKGAKHKPLFGENKKHRVKGIDGLEGIGYTEIDGIGVVAVAAVLAAAAPIIATMSKFLKSVKGDTGDALEPGEANGSLEADAAAVGGDTSELSSDDIDDKGKGADHTGFSLSTPMILGGAAVLGIGVYAMSRK